MHIRMNYPVVSNNVLHLLEQLIVRPKVLLLDEPLSALDAQIRKKLQVDLRSIQMKARHYDDFSNA